MNDWTSFCGVTVPEPKSLLKALESPPRFSSTSSRIRPSTRRTMLPMVSSLGAASTSRFPTFCTLSRSLEESAPRVKDMTLRRRYAVAIAHDFEPLIWRLLSKAMKYSVDVSTGSVATVLRKDAMPGACRPADGAMLVGKVLLLESECLSEAVERKSRILIHVVTCVYKKLTRARPGSGSAERKWQRKRA